MDGSAPLRVAVVNDYDVVVAGLQALLAPYGERVEVIPVVGGLPGPDEVDVVLFETLGRAERLDRLAQIRHVTGAPVVVYSWDTEPAHVASTLARGAHAHLGKDIGVPPLVEQLEAAVRGDRGPGNAGLDESPTGGVWPGIDQGLTEREADIVALIVRGRTNQEIARELFLSINSIKTYIRTAYRKMGVLRRSQAVVWAVEHGFGVRADGRDADPAPDER